MAQLVIFREKSMIGMAAPMDCYVNGQVACKVKNGEKLSCMVHDAVIEFKCGIYCNPKSDVVYLDLTDGKTVNIRIKQGALKPFVTVVEKTASTTQISPAPYSPYSDISKTNPQNDLRTALQTMQKATDISKSNNAIVSTDKSIFSPTREVGNLFAVDENAHLWAIGKGLFPSFKKTAPYSYDDIVDFELIEDGDSIVKGGIGCAVVGGILFGGIGAIVGGSTGKKTIKQTCSNLMIKITVNNIAAPVEYIKLISSATSKNSIVYRNAYQDAQEIIAILQLICDQRSTPNSNTLQSINQATIVDEIRRYKALMDDGIITEEEFLFKKRQLLGM